MQIFSYIITDLAHYESDLIELTLESENDAVHFGGVIAREMLERMPELARRGWCITIKDSERGRIAIVPIDAAH